MAQKQIDAHKVAAESSTPSSEVRENSEKKKRENPFEWKVRFIP